VVTDKALETAVDGADVETSSLIFDALKQLPPESTR
jgi:hypothetical protein